MKNVVAFVNEGM